MKFVPAAISRKVARQALLGQQNAPTILFGVGVAGSVVSTVLACRATLRLEAVLHETQMDLGTARAIEHPDYSEGDRKHDTTLIYARSVGKVVRLYAPAVLVGAASVGCLTKSHNILQERNLALTAAYAAVDEAFKRYRSKVVNEYGEEVDQRLRYEGEIVPVEDEKGNLTEELRASPENERSMYARFFDPLSSSWSKEPEYNLLFLRSQQNYANDLLKARGHVFLNEVYDMLGISRTGAGAVVGWVISHDGDNHIDFGLYDDRDQVRNFVNGREGSILLDFNVDGVIWDKIDQTKSQERLKWQS